MAVIPDFLMSLLENELRSLQENLLRKVAAAYNLDDKEMIDRFLPPTPLQIIPDSVKIVRKPCPRAEVPLEARCKARIWNRGRGGQCTRGAKTEDGLCTHHYKEQEQDGKLRHGWIHDPPSKELFGKPKALYITTTS